MIYFLANYNPLLYPIEHCQQFNWQRWRNKIKSQFYDRPENNMPEKLIVELVDTLVKNHNDPRWYEYYGNIGIVSNSMIMHTAFRVAIKEGRLKPEDFETIYVHENGEEMLVHVDADGRLDHRPEEFFDVYTGLLRRLM